MSKQKSEIGGRVSKKRRLGFLLGTSFAFTFPGYAQQNIEVGDLKKQDVIVVTATKREQTLQEVPVAVTVVDDEVLEIAQINDIFDLQAVVPSLQASQRNLSAGSSFTIRGFGNGQSNAGVEPSVGVFVDGVFRTRAVSAISDLSEIQRIEVLRGPQSTLFGRNSSAGVVSIVTKKPSFQQEGKAEATIGNFGQLKIKGHTTGAITEQTAYSIEAGFNKRQGYATNTYTNSDINNRNRWNVRGQLLWDLNDNLTVRAIADWDELEETCCFADYVEVGQVTRLFELIGAQSVDSRFYDYSAPSDIDPQNEAKNGGISLHSDINLGWADFSSISAYRISENESFNDGDLTTLSTLDLTRLSSSFDTFTQEFRLSGATENFDWLMGAFYLDETAKAEEELSYGPDQRAFADLFSDGAISSVEQLLIGAGVLPSGSIFQSELDFSEHYFSQDQESLSLYGQFDIHANDRLTFTFGGGYSSDKKQVELRQNNQFLFSSLNLVEIGNGLIAQSGISQGFVEATGGLVAPTAQNIGAFAIANPLIFAEIQGRAQAFANANETNPQINTLLGLSGLQFLSPGVEFPNSVESGRSSDGDFNYTIKVTLEASDNVNLYTSFATGYKPTSWNLGSDSRPTAEDITILSQAGLLPNITQVSMGTYGGSRKADPEKSRVIEFGAKSKFDWGSLHVTLFDQEIENFQTNTFQGVSYVFLNAGKQTSQGIELELSAAPLDWMELNVGATYLNAKFEEYLGAPGLNSTPTNFSGERVPQIPELATSTSITFKREFGAANGFARFNWIYESPSRVETNVPAEIERQINSFNASLGVNFSNGFEIMFFGRNLFEDEYITGAFPAVAQPGSYIGYPSAPRTYGMTFRKKF